MKSKVFDLMIEALQSGRYPKTEGRLHEQGDGYCWGGMMCDLSGLAEWYPTGDGSMKYLRETTKLPPQVAEWAGCDDYYGFDFTLHYDRLSPELQDKLVNSQWPDGQLVGPIGLNDAWDNVPLFSFEDMAEIFLAHRDQIVKETEDVC